MRKLLSLVLLSAIALVAAPPRPKPKLVVVVVIDQFRYDYLTRFRASYTGGLARMLDTGAVFTNAHYEHFPTVTAIGHSTVLTGATPSISGIVGNEWYDRETGKQVTSVSDDATELLGGQPGLRGSSPRKLLVSTVADQLRMVDARSKAIGISSKDRSAILPTGRMSNGAYWFDTTTGNFVSSTYYFKQLPDWVVKFNQSRAVDTWLGKAWTSSEKGAVSQKPFLLLAGTSDRIYYNQLDRSPFHNDLLVMFAEAAVEAEQLGADEITDVLTVSFSANDRVGHALGPDSPEVRDISIRSDQSLSRLFAYLDKKVGADNYVTVLTADHGVAPLPEVMRERKMPGGRMPEGVVLTTIQNALVAKYGQGDWLVGKSGPAPYLNWKLIRDKKLDLEEVQNAAAASIRDLPFIYRVYTRTELRRGAGIGDQIDRRVRNGFHYERASDLFVVAAPYWLFEGAGTSHGTPHNYDTHVPVVFMGPGIKAGRYNAHVAVNDIAPTLATMLDIELPTGASGRVLTEMLEQQ
jgi:predicted AlkP superfamily pyrophosphatase or phosphodiesterase